MVKVLFYVSFRFWIIKPKSKFYYIIQQLPLFNCWEKNFVNKVIFQTFYSKFEL